LKRLGTSTLEAETLQALGKASAVLRSHGDGQVVVHGSRFACAARDLDGLRDALEDAVSQQDTEAFRTAAPPIVVFVFGGNGAWWEGMLVEEMENYEVVRQRVESVAAILRRLDPGFDLCALLQDRKIPEDPALAQPMQLAAQLAQADLWKSWGVQPKACIGHSIGEVAAFHEPGFFSEEDAVKIVFNKGRLQQKQMGGAMAVVTYSQSALEQVLGNLDARESLAEIAVENSPACCTVAGEPSSLDVLEIAIREALLEYSFLPRRGVHAAYHSRAMDPILPELKASLHGLAPLANVGTCRVFSTVTRQEAFAACAANVDHWAGNVRERVQFNSAMKACLEAMVGGAAAPAVVCIELSPRKQMAQHIKAVANSLLAVALSRLDERAVLPPHLTKVPRGLPRRDGFLVLNKSSPATA